MSTPTSSNNSQPLTYVISPPELVSRFEAFKAAQTRIAEEAAKEEEVRRERERAEAQAREKKRLKRLVIDGAQDYHNLINELGASICSKMIESGFGPKPYIYLHPEGLERLFEKSLKTCGLSDLYNGSRRIRNGHFGEFEPVLYPCEASLKDYFAKVLNVKYNWDQQVKGVVGSDRNRYQGVEDNTIQTLNNERSTLIIHLSDVISDNFKKEGYIVQNNIMLERAENTKWVAHHQGYITIEVG
jgi:hypothetical protein